MPARDELSALARLSAGEGGDRGRSEVTPQGDTITPSREAPASLSAFLTKSRGDPRAGKCESRRLGHSTSVPFALGRGAVWGHGGLYGLWVTAATVLGLCSQTPSRGPCPDPRGPPLPPHAFPQASVWLSPRFTTVLVKIYECVCLNATPHHLPLTVARPRAIAGDRTTGDIGPVIPQVAILAGETDYINLLTGQTISVRRAWDKTDGVTGPGWASRHSSLDLQGLVQLGCPEPRTEHSRPREAELEGWLRLDHLEP